jgi:MATE family multidrug resistance protein
LSPDPAGKAGRTAWADSARRIAAQAWPVFVGQLSVLAYATIDTLLVARTSATELAALALGGVAYFTVFVGFMGVLLALSPIVGQLYGAGRLQEAGRQLQQALWVATVLSIAGAAALCHPEPILWLARASPEVAAKVRAYLQALALALPAALLFTVYRGFNTAISRPQAAMRLQLASLVLKVPLSAAAVWGVPALGLPALGVVGCGIATCIAMWAQVLAAVWVTRRDPFYAPFEIRGPGLARPHAGTLRQQLQLGLPLGATILVEATGFSFMAVFIARLGTTAVAGHQIASNLINVLFMMPLALGSATSTLVAQAVGGGQAAQARRLGWHGLAMGCGGAAVMAVALLATQDAVLGLYSQAREVVAAARPLLAWAALLHLADAAQIIAAFVLRAYKVTVVPMLIYAAALWGVGLGGGYLLAFDVGGRVPQALQGAPGYWAATTAGLFLAAIALAGFMAWALRTGQLGARIRSPAGG